jgi:hypothetical protein
MMEEMREQRAADRIRIPGAVVVFKKRNKFGFFERQSKPMQLFNINKSGLCFESDRQLNYGEYFAVDVSIPGEDNFRLLGNVRWAEEKYRNDSHRIGAQFLAFGKGRNYNSIKSLERLRELHNKYSLRED